MPAQFTVSVVSGTSVRVECYEPVDNRSSLVTQYKSKLLVNLYTLIFVYIFNFIVGGEVNVARIHFLSVSLANIKLKN